MLRNEKGFMYPLTLCFFILFTTVLTLNIEHYFNERKSNRNGKYPKTGLLFIQDS